MPRDVSISALCSTGLSSPTSCGRPSLRPRKCRTAGGQAVQVDRAGSRPLGSSGTRRTLTWFRTKLLWRSLWWTTPFLRGEGRVSLLASAGRPAHPGDWAEAHLDWRSKWCWRKSCHWPPLAKDTCTSCGSSPNPNPRLSRCSRPRPDIKE